MENNNKPKELLKVIGLQKYFNVKGNILKALENINFNLHEGEIMGLVGESGSGKTTIGRCLINLYSDYDGTVYLDGELISGKKKTKNQKLYLHKNMQMIFQDPHASLNGQQNVFSILKEPLLVNGLIKQSNKDIFSDHKDVIKFFKYHFQKVSALARLNCLNYINKEQVIFYQEWKSKITNINTTNENLEQMSDLLFYYLDSKRSLSAKTIKKISDSNQEQFEKYIEAQNNFRNKNVEVDEQNLINAKKTYKDIKKSLKEGDFNNKIQQNLDKLKEELKIIEKKHKEQLKKTALKVANYKYEFKNDIKFEKQQKNNSVDLNNYFYHFKKYEVYKRSYAILHDNKSYVKYLSSLQVEELVNNIDTYQKKIFNSIVDYGTKMLQREDVKSLKEKILKKITKEFQFSFSKYRIIALDYHKQYFTKVNFYVINIDKQKEILQKNIDSESVLGEQKLKRNLEIASINLAKTNKAFKYASFIFSQKFYSEMKQIEDKISREKIKKFKIEKLNKNLFKIFEEKLKIAFKKYSEFSKDTDNEKSKQLKQQLSLLKSKFNERLETLKSFDIETKYLLKDGEQIKHLFGIGKNIFSKKYIKKIFLNQKIYNALEDVGLLRQFAYRYPHEFSGGQRQRIVIARALITEPKVIVADEPIASLDISIQAQVVNLLKDLCKEKGIGLIFIAHDLSMVEYIADNMNILHLGKIVEKGNVVSIYSNPIHPYTINLFESIPKISNANEKFESSNFNADYLKEQTIINPPSMHEVEPDHYIFGTNDQFTKWNKKNNKSSKIHEN